MLFLLKIVNGATPVNETICLLLNKDILVIRINRQNATCKEIDRQSLFQFNAALMALFLLTFLMVQIVFLAAGPCMKLSFAGETSNIEVDHSTTDGTPSIITGKLLKDHPPVIHAAGDHNYPPYEFLDPNGQPAGFNIDIFRAVCEILNLKYEIHLGPWNHVRQQLENGEIDLITGMYFSPERDKKLDFSTPHIIVSQSLFVKKGSKIALLEDLSGKEVVVQKGDIMDDFIQSQGRSITVITVPDQVDALRLLSEGKHDCAILSKLQGLYLIHKYNFTSLEAVGSSLQQRDYCFAVREGDQKLLTQLNEGLSTLRTRGVYRQIHNKWFGVYEKDEAWQNFLQFMLWAAIPISLLFVGIVAWNRMLKHNVAIATTALIRSENLYREFVALAVDGIVLGSPDGIIIEANQVLCEWLQIPYDQLIGKHISQLPWSSAILEKSPFRFDLLNSGQTITRVRALELKDGRQIYIEMRSKKMPDGGYQSIFRDISERIKAEEDKERLMSQLAQSQKMEAVGRLAGGIAHDFNNMLGVIIGYADMAMIDVEPGDPLHAELEGILKAARRSSDLTRQLLAFARKQTIVPQILDLKETIANMLTMLRRLMGEDIDLAWIPSKEKLWQVKMDPSQIDQILANLCVNARDAIKHMGKVTIEIENITISEAYCDLHAGFHPGEYVMLAVSDNGCGIDRECMVHLFEPFFTTKGVGQGTGLGLATVYGIVKQNSGFINVYSEVGHGTTFRIYIPKSDDPADHSRKEVGKSRSAIRGKERVLIVEDEPMLLELTHSMVERLGYRVVSASTPQEALQIAERETKQVKEEDGREAIDLIITDVVMPEMNGRELAKRVVEISPHTRYLFMSGYTANVIAHHGILDKDLHFIQKPFSINELAAKIREILDEL